MPVLNGVAVSGIHFAVIQVERTAVDLNGNEIILRERAALDGQAGVLGNAVVADAHQRRALPLRVAAVVLDGAALEGQQAFALFALNVDDIVGGNTGVLRGILTHDGTGLRLAAVLDSDPRVINLQRGLALLGAAIQGEAVQVENDIVLADRHILAGIRQQGHGRISTGRIDGSLQGLVLDVVGFGNVSACLDAVSTISIGGGDEALSAVLRGNRRGERTAGDGSVRLIPRLLAVVFPAISLNRTDTRSAGKRAAADGHGGSTGGIRAIHDGNSRAVRDGAVAGLAGNVTVAGGADRTACHIQSACTHLNAAGHAVNLTAADRHRTGLRMIDGRILVGEHLAAADVDGGILQNGRSVAGDGVAVAVDLTAVDIDDNARLRVALRRAENGNRRRRAGDLAAVDVQDLLTVSGAAPGLGLALHVHAVVAGDLGAVLNGDAGLDAVLTAGNRELHTVCLALHRQVLQSGGVGAAADIQRTVSRTRVGIPDRTVLDRPSVDLEVHGILARAGHGVAVQIDGNILYRRFHIVGAQLVGTQIDIAQHIDGLVRLNGINSRLQRLVLDIADLRSVSARLDAESTVTVVFGNEALRAVLRGNRAGERTAGDSRLRAGFGRSAGNAPVSDIQITTVDRQRGSHFAGDIHHDLAGELGIAADRGLANGFALFPSIRPQLAVDLAAGDVGLEPVLDRGVVAGDLTAGDMQHTQCTILNGDEVILRKRAALNSQRTPLVTIAVADQGAADHGTGRIRLPVAGVVDHGTAFDGHRALIADDVVGGLTHNTSVITLDGTGLGRAGILNGDRTIVGQRSLSRTGAAAQGLAVQVESQILLLCDLDILSHILQQRHSVAVIGSRDGSGQRSVTSGANHGDRSLSRYALQRQLRIGLPLQSVVSHELVATGVLHGRTGRQTRMVLAVGRTVHSGIQRRSVLALGVGLIQNQIELGVGAEVHAHVLVAAVVLNIKAVAGSGDGGSHLPLGDALKLHGTGAGDSVAGEVDGGQGLEVAALALVIALGPVAVGRTDPCGVGAVGIYSIGVVLELTPVKRQRLSRNSAHDDAVEGAVVKLQLAQLAPGRGVQLIVEAHDVGEGDILERHVGVSGHCQQQGRTDVVDILIARDAAGDGAADEHDALANGRVTVLAALGTRCTVVVHLGAVFVGVVRRAVAQNAVGVIGVVTHGHVHGAAQLLLRSNVLRTGHGAQLRQRVGVGLSTDVGISIFRHAKITIVVFGNRKAVGQIALVHIAGERTSGDVEQFLVSIANTLFAVNLERTADIAATGRDNDLFSIRRTLDSLLEQTLVATDSTDVGQRDIRCLGSNNSRLLGQAFEGGILNLHRRRSRQRTFVIGLDTTGTGEGAVLDLRVATVVPQVVLARGVVGEMAVVKHSLAILTIARTIRERTIGIGNCMTRIANYTGEVVCRMAEVIHPRTIRMGQRQVFQFDIDIHILNTEDGLRTCNADLGIRTLTDEYNFLDVSSVLHKADPLVIARDICLAVDFIGNDAVDRRCIGNGLRQSGVVSAVHRNEIGGRRNNILFAALFRTSRPNDFVEARFVVVVDRILRERRRGQQRNQHHNR